MANNSILDDLRYKLRYGNMYTRLILVNLAVFVVLILCKIIFGGILQSPDIYATIIKYLGVPHDTSLFFRPWTIFTYMFTHEGLFHFGFNMLLLYWFGQIFSIFLNDKKILSLYILGGLSGAAAYILIANLLPQITMGPMMIGASAGVMAIIFACATLNPDYELQLVFLGRVKLKYIALAMVLFDLVGIASMSNTGGHLAHLGGGLLGYLFIKQLRLGNDWSKSFDKIGNRLSNLFNKPAPKGPRTVHKSKNFSQSYSRPISSRAKKASSPGAAPSANNEQQLKIDAILDKIGESGYDSLSQEEKEFLFKLRDKK